MSVADVILSLIIAVVKGTILKLPSSTSAISMNGFASQFSVGASTFLSGWNFADNFFPITLTFALFVAILIAEPLLHLGWKGAKYVINLIRGSGG